DRDRPTVHARRLALHRRARTGRLLEGRGDVVGVVVQLPERVAPGDRALLVLLLRELEPSSHTVAGHDRLVGLVDLRATRVLDAERLVERHRPFEAGDVDAVRPE